MTTRDPSQSDEAEPRPSNREKDPDDWVDQHRTDEPATDQPRTDKRGS